MSKQISSVRRLVLSTEETSRPKKVAFCGLELWISSGLVSMLGFDSSRDAIGKIDLDAEILMELVASIFGFDDGFSDLLDQIQTDNRILFQILDFVEDNFEDPRGVWARDHIRKIKKTITYRIKANLGLQ